MRRQLKEFQRQRADYMGMVTTAQSCLCVGHPRGRELSPRHYNLRSDFPSCELVGGPCEVYCGAMIHRSPPACPSAAEALGCVGCVSSFEQVQAPLQNSLQDTFAMGSTRESTPHPEIHLTDLGVFKTS